MNDANGSAWDGTQGTAGGPAFGAALHKLAEAAQLDAAGLAQLTDLSAHQLEAVFAGRERLAVAPLARIVLALRMRPIEFMQKSGLLSLEVYASGLDPLYFLPEGPVRYDARIYMREINPRHPVPEADMSKRNPVLEALAADTVVDRLGKLEVEMTYLLRAASEQTGGTL
ncbi:MAG: hypothetical protein JOZ38_05800 [Candidatus Eremiobacteraeota bacterium]|nr:hypothetical protein [Candidatus Eremiobacteraeota bacterium]